jgi:hypothetical protein
LVLTGNNFEGKIKNQWTHGPPGIDFDTPAVKVITK